MIVCRIAPSPTGDPHVGTAYISIFNWLIAKKFNGKLILRIEDTDNLRSEKNFEDKIVNELKWIGVEWTEFYRQSERKEIYKKYVDILLKKGFAYKCDCSKERLENLRKKQISNKKPAGYDGFCRSRNVVSNNSVIRLKIPEHIKTINFCDSIRGEISFDINRIDDQILIKSDGMPTYHLANVVDDHLMNVTDVIRAEEWINSTPKHVLMYKMFNWKQPNWIHLPLLKKEDGGKISKRLGDRSLSYYRENGFLPISLINMFFLLGMKHIGDIEVMDFDMIIKNIKISNFSKNSPIFDEKKLKWLNREHMKKIETSKLIKMLNNFSNHDNLYKIVEKLKFSEYTLKDISNKIENFFQKPDIIEMEKIFNTSLIKTICKFSVSNIDFKILDKLKMEFNIEKKESAPILRYILTGQKNGFSISEIIEILGEKEIIKKLNEVNSLLI